MPTLLMRSGREIKVLGEYDDVYTQAMGSMTPELAPDFTEFSERNGPAGAQTIAVRRSQIEGVCR